MSATIREVRDAIRSGTRSAADVCSDALARIEQANPSLNAFNTVVADRAMARAREIDKDPDRWRSAPLAGVPVALKDNLCTRGVRRAGQCLIAIDRRLHLVRAVAQMTACD